MPDLPPWVVEALARGATVGFFLACVAVVWLARKLDEREAARAAADAAHMNTITTMVPVVRDVATSLQGVSRRLEALDVVIREDVTRGQVEREHRR